MKVVSKILLLVAVAALTYVCVLSINGPIEFKKEREAREKKIISRLINIRKAQIEYKNLHGQHAGTFAELIKFLNEEHIPFLIKEGELTDKQLESGMTEAEAVKKGLIRRDTIWVLAGDTLFNKAFKYDSIQFVPGFSAKFEMDTASIQSSAGYSINVFEARVPYDVYLEGLNKQEIVNLKDIATKRERYAGLKVGSITEVNNNAGNWE